INNFYLVYLNNILIYTNRSFKYLLLDISKYKFNITFIKYLSFIIKVKKSLYINFKKVKAIKE
ncbi:hypothetical protein BDV96DRAFT_506746, partial [Lophiotrema nucula]